MRVHIYSQEIDLNPSSVQIVETTADTGRTYYGLRFYLHSAPQLHHAADDDDRSAVTFWLPGRPGRPGHTQAFADLLQEAAALVDDVSRRYSAEEEA